MDPGSVQSPGCTASPAHCSLPKVYHMDKEQEGLGWRLLPPIEETAHVKKGREGQECVVNLA